MEGETLRRRLHNTLQELKGNIRVFCRVRPPAAGEADEAAPGRPVLAFPAAGELAGRGLELVQPAGSGGKERGGGGSSGEVGQAHSFAFDRVFAPTAPQVSYLQLVGCLAVSPGQQTMV